MKFKSLIFIVLAASMTCTDIYAENNRPIETIADCLQRYPLRSIGCR